MRKVLLGLAIVVGALGAVPQVEAAPVAQPAIAFSMPALDPVVLDGSATVQQVQYYRGRDRYSRWRRHERWRHYNRRYRRY